MFPSQYCRNIAANFSYYMFCLFQKVQGVQILYFEIHTYILWLKLLRMMWFHEKCIPNVYLFFCVNFSYLLVSASQIFWGEIISRFLQVLLPILTSFQEIKSELLGEQSWRHGNENRNWNSWRLEIIFQWSKPDHPIWFVWVGEF